MYLTYHKEIDPTWAWSPYTPSEKQPWTLEMVGHLYRRAAWGANWMELKTALKNGPDSTIQVLLQGSPGQEDFYQRAAQLATPLAESADDLRLRAWWIYVMLNSPHPLLERMTLFWHNHFATSNSKVQDVGFMHRQNQLLRKHALGRFGPMLHEISEDPAMLIWLDSVANKKGKPNENYARELMELFSLGVGNYSEYDIREAARAFTGWSIKNNAMHLNQDEHDTGDKTVFGKKGNLTGHQVVDLCLEKKECAQFLVRKLFRWLISETLTPTDALLEPLAVLLRTSHYSIKDVVATILRSNLFFSPDAYRARVKSPIEFGVSIIHMLEGRVDAIQFAEMLDPLGQRLFAPPSVKGWDGGPNWLNSTTMLLRHNLCLAITSTEDRRFYNRCDPAKLVVKHAGEESTLVSTTKILSELLLQNDIPEATRAKLNDRCEQLRQQKYASYWSKQFIHEHQIRSMAHLMMTLPEFQLA